VIFIKKNWYGLKPFRFFNNYLKYFRIPLIKCNKFLEELPFSLSYWGKLSTFFYHCWKTYIFPLRNWLFPFPATCAIRGIDSRLWKTFETFRHWFIFFVGWGQVGGFPGAMVTPLWIAIEGLELVYSQSQS